MKHDAWRRQPETYPFSGEILPRYTDVDLWQHLNNVALISLQIESVQRLLLDVADDAAWRAGPAASSRTLPGDFPNRHGPAWRAWAAKRKSTSALKFR